MEQTPKRIIRKAEIEGVVFFHPYIQSKPEITLEIEAQTQAKMQEVLLHKKMGQNEPTKEFEDIWKEGETEGYRRGLIEGQRQGYEAGKEEGLAAGFIEGTEKAHSELKNLLQLLNAVAMGLGAKQVNIFEQLRPDIIQFILTVCEHILHRALLSPNVFIDLIEQLLIEAKSILKEAIITVVFAPEDLEMLENDLKKVIYDHEEIKKLNFVADKSIERGNCRVETSLGIVNFDIKRMLADLEKKVLEVKHEEES